MLSLEYSFVDGYGYGFNGMEKDDEVKGAGNSLDFGARIYDVRIGRFLSMDPLIKSFPQQASYQISGNNPIYFVDLYGEEKVTYLTIIDENGKKTEYKLVNSEEVEYRRVRLKEGRSGMRNVSIERHITLDKRDNSSTITKEKMYDAYDPISSFLSATLGVSIEGPGGSQKGGLFLVSEDGGASPTKQIAEERDPRMVEITSLLAAIGAKGKSYKVPDVEMHDLLESIKNVTEQAESMGNDQSESSSPNANSESSGVDSSQSLSNARDSVILRVYKSENTPVHEVDSFKWVDPETNKEIK